MGEEGFKHIAVNAAEDDDFVIRVGMSNVNQGAESPEDAKDTAADLLESADDVAAVEVAPVAGAEAIAEPVAEAAAAAAAEVASVAEIAADRAKPIRTAVEPEAEHTAGVEGADAATEAHVADAAPEAAADARGKAKDVAGGSQRRPQKDDGYHETTLEDLKGEKMSLTQRVVIIAAIICIIGAIVYYFAFMR